MHALHAAGMTGKSQKQRLKDLLVETIQVLCKNSLAGESSICIEATIGITLSSDRVMVISFKECIESDGSRLSLKLSDDHDCEQPHSKNTNNETDKHSPQSCSCSSYVGSVSCREHLKSGNSEGADILQTCSSSSTAGREVNQELNMPEMHVFDNDTMPSHVASFQGNEASSSYNYSLPDFDTLMQSTAAIHETDANDDVLIIKVEEDDDDNNASAAGIMQQDTEVAMSLVPSGSNVHKQKRRRRRTDADVVHKYPRQPESAAYFEADEVDHLDGSHQQDVAFGVRYIHFIKLFLDGAVKFVKSSKTFQINEHTFNITNSRPNINKHCLALIAADCQIRRKFKLNNYTAR